MIKRLRNFNPSRGLEVTEVSNPSVIEPTPHVSQLGKLKLASTESELGRRNQRTCGVPVKLEQSETAKEVESKTCPYA